MAFTHAAVLGSPIAHSLSPVLHNAAYKALGLTDWTYGRQDINETKLEGFFASVDSSWAGVSMTMPLKKKALEYGDIYDDRVHFLGVANTAVFDWTRPNKKSSQLPHISLYNTDIDGIKLTFMDEFGAGDLFGKVILIIGSGSTATSACAAMIEMGARDFTICAVDRGQATSVAEMMSAYRGSNSRIAIDSWDSALKHMRTSDIVISAVPAHATDNLATHITTELSAHDLARTIILDVIYDPRPTQLMTAASNAGAQVRGGEHMLLRQALAQVAYMTHKPVHEVISLAFAEMKTALIENL